MAANSGLVKQEDLSQEENHPQQEIRLQQENVSQQTNPSQQGSSTQESENAPYRNYPREAPSVSWEVFKSHEVPSQFTSCIFRGEKISYAYLNTVKTWHWKTDEEELLFFPLERGDNISVIAELWDKNLVVGSEKGFIYPEKSLWSPTQLVKSPVKDIISLGPNHFIVKYNNEKKVMVKISDVMSSENFLSFDAGTEICRFRENCLVEARGRDVKIQNVDDAKEAPIRSFRLDAECTDVRVVNERFVLFKHANGLKFTIWDTEQDRNLEAPLKYTQNQFRILEVIDLKTLLIPDRVSPIGTRLDKYTYNGRWWEVHHGPFAGEFKVTSMLRVRNHIMYGSQSQAAGVHVFTLDCDWLFSDTKCTENGTHNPLELANLVDGFVAVRLTKSRTTSKVVVIREVRKYKDRLFVGEGDFSFTKAFLNKHGETHPRLPRHVTATELKTEIDDFTRRRVEELRRRGVDVILGVDARKLGELFPERRFHSVHWNCPCGISSDDPTFVDVLPKFFDSCARIQRPGDRVHVTLMEDGVSMINFRQKQNPIVSASAFAGYRLVKKRKFGEDRYPGYSHVSTSGVGRFSSKGDSLREFVFEQVALRKPHPSTKRHRVVDGTHLRDVEDGRPANHFFEVSSDEDSSTLGDDDDDIDEVGTYRTRERSPSGIPDEQTSKRMRGEEADQPASTSETGQVGIGGDGSV